MKWNEHQLDTRDSLIAYFTRYLARELGKVNAAFRFLRIESPIVLPYTVDKARSQQVRIKLDSEEMVLRENTSTGAYEASREILSGKAGFKQRLPIVVYQHGSVFEKSPRGQLKEQYHLEYQILFSKTTGMPYDPVVMKATANMLFKQCGTINEVVNSQPDNVADNNLEIFDSTKNLLASVRRRTDFWAGNNIEVVLKMDSVVNAAIALENFGRTRKASIRS